MKRTTRTLFVLAVTAVLCLPVEAQVRFPLDEATGFQGAVVMPGAVGNAVRLNGYTSYAKKKYNASSLSTTQQTISVWCAPETYPMMNAREAENAFTSIIETIDETAHTGFALQLSSQGNLRFECYSDGWKQTLETDVLLPAYQWSHIVVTLDAVARESKMYLNGEKIAQGRTMSALSAGSGTMLIGKDGQTKTYSSFMLNTFNGLIDDVRIDSRIWSDEEINALPQHEADLIFPQDAFYSNRLRSHFHGQPMMGWTNETHGMIYRDGTYHLFFQKNPNGPYMARLHWGHLVSSDLCGWEEVPVALAPSEMYDIKGCWSGCVFADEQLTGGEPWIAYTGVDNAKATIDFAMPAASSLLEWIKSANNPRINGRPAGLTDDFRDPCFFRNGDKAYMIVGSSKNGVGVLTLHEFLADGSLTNDGRLFFSGSDAASCGTFFEMPTLTQTGDRWLLTVTPLGSASGVRTIYWVGTVNADGQFVPDNAAPQTVELPGLAREGYGLLSPTVCQLSGKTIALGIVPDKLAAAVNYDMGWAHSYSLPREWSLSDDGTLEQKPFSGLTALRRDTVTALQAQVTDPFQVEMEAEFTVGTDNCAFHMLDDQLKVYYEPSANRIVVDMTALRRKTNDAGVFNGLYASALPQPLAQGSTLRLHTYLDHSVLDLFVNDQWASSVRLFPSAQAGQEVSVTGPATRVAIYNLETTATPKTYTLVQPEPDQTGDNEAVDDVMVNGRRADGGWTKVLRNGQLYLMYEGQMYNVLGAQL
ncbi:MAG: GH32 C-terminal domain-containing protein [Paludibacteraceae bacterium]|nr:GH32 C-terminal domain-containing protein [Paludibacteraceae bacterium]